MRSFDSTDQHVQQMRPGLRRAASIAASFVLALGGLATASPTSASAAPPDITFKVNRGKVGALSGVTHGWTAIRASMGGPNGGPLHVTNDGGATWKPLGVWPRQVSTGYIYWADSAIRAAPISGGAELSYYTDSFQVAAAGTRVALANGTVVDISTGEQLLSGLSSVVGITDAGVVTKTDGSWRPQTFTLRAWDGSSRTLAADLPASEVVESTMVGDQLRVLMALSAEWQLCSMPVSSTGLQCRKIADRAADEYTWEALGGNETATLVSLPGRVLLVEGTKVTPVSPVDGIPPRIGRSDGGGRPVVVAQSTTYSVGTNGSLTAAVPFPMGDLDTRIEGLTPGRVATTDNTDSVDGCERPSARAAECSIWIRSIGAVAGAQLKAPSRASAASLSGTRTALATSAGITIMEGDSSARQLAGLNSPRLSGPYLLASRPTEWGVSRLFDVTGKDLAIAGADLFGSRIVGVNAAATAVTVTDIAKAVTPFKELPLTTGRSLAAGPFVYGDWVGWSEWDESWTSTTVVHNLVTGSKLTRADAMLQNLGDGFADMGDRWWRFADGAIVDVPWGETDSVNRQAFVKDGEVVIRTIDGFGTSAARVLGVLAPASLNMSASGATWTPEIDSSKGITAGSIEIRNSSGQVVRSLTTPASATGSVRGVSWNGRNTSGTVVSNGTYAWTFTADSADGTGLVKAVDGTSAVSGTIIVTGASPFLDVPPGTAHAEHIIWLANQGISTGWNVAGGKEFRPLQPVNRDAMAAFMYRLAGSPAYTPPTVSPFKDVTPATAFYKEISWLASKGISTGWAVTGGKEFRPLEPVNRDAMAAFLYRLYGKPAFTAPTTSPFKDITPSTAFYKEMSWLATNGISTGWNVAGGAEFRPGQPVNRDAMAAFMHRGYDKWGTPKP